MHTRTVEARETLRQHEMVSVTGDCARRYTGEGATANVELGLATEDMDAGQRGEISVFIALPEPLSNTPDEPSHEARVFDAPEVIISEESVPPTVNDVPLARRLRAAWIERMGASNVVDQPTKGMGAEDFPRRALSNA